MAPALDREGAPVLRQDSEDLRDVCDVAGFDAAGGRDGGLLGVPDGEIGVVGGVVQGGGGAEDGVEVGALGGGCVSVVIWGTGGEGRY